MDGSGIEPGEESVNRRGGGERDRARWGISGWGNLQETRDFVKWVLAGATKFERIAGGGIQD